MAKKECGQQPYELKIGFPNKKSAKAFMNWLCESGEQDYWTFMECQDDHEHLMVSFDYQGNMIETSLMNVED